jgi:hypothetical protein
MASNRLTEWMEKHGQGSVYRVSDEGFSHLDRNEWNADSMSPENFTLKFDSHLPLKVYLPFQWNRLIRPAVSLISCTAKTHSKLNGAKITRENSRRKT